MGFHEPSGLEIGLTNFFTYRLFAPRARKYVNSLGLNGDEKLLDYGSGNGAVTRFLARRLQEGGHITCVDLSEKWQKVIRKKLGGFTNIDFFQGSIGDFAASDGKRSSFDAVFVHYVLHDIPTEERQGKVVMLAEFLRPGGKFFIKEPTKSSHGIPGDEVKELFKAAEMNQKEINEKKNTLTGVFQKT